MMPQHGWVPGKGSMAPDLEAAFGQAAKFSNSLSWATSWEGDTFHAQSWD